MCLVQPYADDQPTVSAVSLPVEDRAMTLPRYDRMSHKYTSTAYDGLSLTCGCRIVCRKTTLVRTRIVYIACTYASLYAAPMV